MREYGHFFVDGMLRRSTGAGRMSVVDPTTGEEVANVVGCSPSDLDAAIDSAKAGLRDWCDSTIDERRAVLQRLHDALAARTDAAVNLLAEEMGCPVWLGRLMQLPMPLEGLELAMGALTQIQWDERIGNGLAERVPTGVVAAITPWNFPLDQIVSKVAAAIAAGCSVVLKPSEIAPGATMLFCEAVREAGLPPGVVNMVWGDADLGDALVRHDGIDRVSFTGSTKVGRPIMAAAAERLTPCTLELGGKSAAVLLDDADLDAAIPAVARMSLANSGQACVSQSRLIAPRHLVPEIVNRLQAAFAQWPLGDPLDAATRLGPVATKSQHVRIKAMIAGGVTDGARLVIGGARTPAGFDKGFYVLPTVFAEVRADMQLAQDEVFGPVLAIMAYGEETQASALANSTRYGLSGAAWSRDPSRALALARTLKTGQVVINGAPQNLATPLGGWGLSGFGHENGRFGVEDLLNYRSLHGA